MKTFQCNVTNDFALESTDFIYAFMAKKSLENVKEKNYTTSFYTLNLDLFANTKNYFEY